MRAILIDPFTQSLSEVSYSGNYQDIYKLIQCEGRPFTAVRLSEDDYIFIDDEGLFQPSQRFFQFSNYPQPLAGRGLVIGQDEEGESIDAVYSIEDLRSQVSWLPESLRFIGMEQKESRAQTVFGPTTIISRKALFGTEQ